MVLQAIVLTATGIAVTVGILSAISGNLISTLVMAGVALCLLSTATFLRRTGGRAGDPRG